MLILVVALVILLTTVLTFKVHAQELANNATVNSHTERSAGKNTTVVTYSSNNSTLSEADVLLQHGVLGKGIDKAPGLQKPFNPKAVEHAGIKKFLNRFHELMRKQFMGKKEIEPSAN